MVIYISLRILASASSLITKQKYKVFWLSRIGMFFIHNVLFQMLLFPRISR